MKTKTWQIIVVIICIILGTLLHYIFKWSGEKIIVGLFSAVNESTWEHLKLIFYPMLLMAIIGYFIAGKRTDNYWFAQVSGIFIAIMFTVVFFYTYIGVIGTNIHWLNIAIFVISILIGGYVIYKILVLRKSYNSEFVSIIFLIILLFSFILYTFYPPRIQIFKDPITGAFGIRNMKIQKKF